MSLAHLQNRRFKSRKSRLALQPLEERAVLATNVIDLNNATAAPKFIDIVDGDGDNVRVQLAGTGGTATITDDGAGNITDVAITNPSTNFIITFVNQGGGDGNVSMGSITANKAIKSILTVKAAAADVFTMNGFVGVGISTTINVGTILPNANGVALSLTNGLQAKQSINVNGAVDGDVILSSFGGSINIAGAVLDGGDGSVWNINGDYKNTAMLTVGSGFLADLNVKGLTSGAMNVSGQVAGAVTFLKDVQARARLVASEWFDVNANAAFGGAISAGFATGTLDLFVKTNLLGSAQINSAGGVTLEVDGNVLAAALINANQSVSADIGGNFSGRVNSGSNVTLNVNGNVIGARVNSDVIIELDVNGSVLAKSNFLADAGISADIQGAIADSTFTTESSITLDVGGAVAKSNFFANEALSAEIGGTVTNSTLSGSETESTITIHGGLVNSKVNSGSENLTMSVDGSIVNSRVTSSESNLELTVGGNITASRFVAGEAMTLDIGGTVTTSHFDAGNLIDAEVDGSIVDTVMVAVNFDTEIEGSIFLDLGLDLVKSHLTSDELFLTIGRHVTDSVLVATFADLSADIGGNLTNSTLTASEVDVTLTVGGNVVTTEVDASGALFAEITGNVVSSKLVSDEGDTGLSVDIGGDVVDSQLILDDTGGGATFTANIDGNVLGNSVLESTGGDMLVVIGKSLTDSTVNGVTNVNVQVGGNIVRSAITAGGTANLSVVGNIADSDVSANNENIEVEMAGSITNSQFSALTEVSVSVGGSVTKGNFQSASDAVRIFVTGGSFTSGSVQAATTALIKTPLDFGASVDAAGLDLQVGRDVLATSIIQTLNSEDDDGDSITFQVGRDFLGQLSVAGSFFTGTGGSQTLVGRDVGAAAVLNINSIDETQSATEFLFNGAFKGELNLWGDLDVELHVIKDLALASIQGQVLSNVTVGGKVVQFSSGSLFDQTSATTGDFLDGTGATTATLTAGSIGEVDPRLIV